MSVIVRTYTPANVMQGGMNLYINIAAPPSALVPTSDSQTLTLDALGQPTSSTGFHLGLVDSPTMPTVTEKLNEIHADQLDMPFDVALDSISAEVDLVMKESNLSKLQTLISAPNSAFTSITGQLALQVGGQISATVNFLTVLAVQATRNASGKYSAWMLYRATLTSSIVPTFHRSKESTFKLKFKGVGDTTRVPGDELMMIQHDT